MPAEGTVLQPGEGPSVSVTLPLPLAEAYAYLTDPRNRPEWQASLRAVTELSGGGEPGTTWRDVTAVGARPRMEVTVAGDDWWVETGCWYGLSATLRLDFADATVAGEPATRVTATVRLSGGRPVWGLLARGLQQLTPTAVAADLRRAARRG